MELPIRATSDRFAEPGDFRRLSERLRSTLNGDVPVLIVGAFDHRTRMLPFIFWDRQIVPAGIRAISAALSTSGFTRQRVISQSWTPLVRPSLARIDGRPPELLLISSMQIHSAAAKELIRDAHTMGAERPLIIIGGPWTVYQPWAAFGFDQGRTSADLACTGEELVLLEMLDRLRQSKRADETYRAAFERARGNGWLDDIPGLMYSRATGPGRCELVDTGVQRLVRDFDELPPPVEGYRFLERPHRGRFLDRQPLPLRDVRRYSRVASILTTRGCKFRCSYCPIPAYNQLSFRTRSPERLVRDLAGLRREAGLHLFFGTDDNFFNDERIVIDTFEALARAGFDKDDIGRMPRLGTEATEYDVHKQLDVMELCYRGGLRAIWFGIEDMTATLIKKGQSVSKTQEMFQALRRHRIVPMAMLMHYEGQPLVSRGSMAGLLNQVRFLQKTGACSLQVTVLTPATGTKDFEQVYESGIVLKRVGGTEVEDCYLDGNHVVTTGSGKPWKIQWNILLAYGLFYNPFSLARRFFWRQGKWSDIFVQFWGMWGLAATAWRLLPWIGRLKRVAKGDYEVHSAPHASQWPIVPANAGQDPSDAAAEPDAAKPAATPRRAALAHY